MEARLCKNQESTKESNFLSFQTDATPGIGYSNSFKALLIISFYHMGNIRSWKQKLWKGLFIY